MTSTDYIIDLGLIAIVALQMRGRRLSTFTLLLPFALIAWAASSYLKSVPTAGNDLVLIAIAVVAGTSLGALCGLYTSVSRDASGALVAKAGLLAAIFWVLGVGARFAFQFYATHGGGPSIGRFMVAHNLTSSQVWAAALILMAFGEVLARSAVIWARAYALRRSGAVPAVSAVGDRALAGTPAAGTQTAGTPTAATFAAGRADHDGWR